MKKYRYLSAILLVAAGLMTACSQDDIVDTGSLPYGEYPVEIASVTISGMDADQPQTRVSESGDGTYSALNTNEIIYGKFEGSDQVGAWRYNGYSFDDVTPLYWRWAFKTENLISWHVTGIDEAGVGTVSLADQSDGLVYVLRGTQQVKYGTNDINLNLQHQLSKVRVWLQGTGDATGKATAVTINNVPASCDVEYGAITGQSATTGSITMYKTTVDNLACFEATLLPGSKIGGEEAFTVSLDGSNHNIEVDELEVKEAGKLYTVTLTLHKSGTQTIDLSTSDKEISGNGTYYFTGTGTHSIKVTSGSPTIYLAEADINVSSGHAIEVAGGSPTIVIQRNVNLQSSAGAGVYVTSGSVTIKSDKDDDRNSRLTARGGSNDTDVYPGIGGAMSTTINLNDLYVYAYASKKEDNHSPAIGAKQTIGSIPLKSPTVNLTDCYVCAYRVSISNVNNDSDMSKRTRSYAQHIGTGGNADNDNGGDRYSVSCGLGGGIRSNSTVEGYTISIRNWDNDDYHNGTLN